MERGGLKVRPWPLELRRRARGRRRPRPQCHPDLHLVEQGVPRCRRPAELRKAPDQELRIGFPGALEPRHPLGERHGVLVQSRRLRVAREQRQPVFELVERTGQWPVHVQVLAPAGGQPAGGCAVERVVDRRAGDARVIELSPKAAQVPAGREAGQQALDNS